MPEDVRSMRLSRMVPDVDRWWSFELGREKFGLWRERFLREYCNMINGPSCSRDDASSWTPFLLDHEQQYNA